MENMPVKIGFVYTVGICGVGYNFQVMNNYSIGEQVLVFEQYSKVPYGIAEVTENKNTIGSSMTIVYTFEK